MRIEKTKDFFFCGYPVPVNYGSYLRSLRASGDKDSAVITLETRTHRRHFPIFVETRRLTKIGAF